MIIPLKISRKLSSRLRGIGKLFLRFFTGLDGNLKETDIGLDGAEYITICLLNSGAMSRLFFSMLFSLVFFVQSKTLMESLLIGMGSGAGIFLLFFFILVTYPKILAGKKAEKVDKNLLFALKDLLLQISAGVPLFNAFINIVNSSYGEVSEEFEKTARSINAGMPLENALERMAIETKSEYLKRTVWQLLNTIRAGASLKGSLKTIIDELTLDQRSRIRDYAQELNMWSLVYMLFAVTIPTIGLTMIVVLSSFAGFDVNQATLVMFVIGDISVQFVLIGFVKSRRPLIQF
jgi:flagellar protein FlaJ